MRGRRPCRKPPLTLSPKGNRNAQSEAEPARQFLKYLENRTGRGYSLVSEKKTRRDKVVFFVVVIVVVVVIA